MAELLARYPRTGRLDWIGLRPARHAPMTEASTAVINLSGLVGDHRARPGKRAVSLIQTEHLDVIATLAACPGLPPSILRRNLMISGVNILSARGRSLRIGGVLLRIAGPCAPCSRMETALGPGGYNAMRGHGGMVAEVLECGEVRVGDAVSVTNVDAQADALGN